MLGLVFVLNFCSVVIVWRIVYLVLCILPRYQLLSLFDLRLNPIFVAWQKFPGLVVLEQVSWKWLEAYTMSRLTNLGSALVCRKCA